MTIKVAFLSCQENLVAPFLERVAKLYPELPLFVVSEFPPPPSSGAARWIPFKPNRGFAENYARCRGILGKAQVRLSAVVLEPRTPYGQMRWIAFFLAPRNWVAFNENLDHFMLRPRCLGSIARHLLWRAKNFFRWQFSPGGPAYTWAWRLAHPKHLRRPLFYAAGRLAGAVASRLRPLLGKTADPPPQASAPGISVVIPTRNGRILLDRLLPLVLADLTHPSEVILVDNGSDDGTAQHVSANYPSVRVDHCPEPLSFAAAVNRGLRAARYSHVCLLNNDMVIASGFFMALRSAFDRNPDLFCATAQIFFPEGMRRQETGKAVWWTRDQGRPLRDFPLRCLIPLPGEDGTYVLYGSGGCSMYSAAKLRQLGGFDELLAPAYVEDLDLGWRAWQRNWPTVYTAGAGVTHFHRSTTSRYFQPALLQSFLEFNFLRFLIRRVTKPALFTQLWREALDRLNVLAVEQAWFDDWALSALGYAWKAVRHLAPAPAQAIDEETILALGSGEVASFPGQQNLGRRRVLVVSPYLPYPLSHGGAVRIYNLMRRAAACFDQILVAFVEELASPPGPLLEICAEVVLVRRKLTHLLPDRGRPDVVEEFASPTMQAVLEQLVRKWTPSLAQLEFTQMAQYAPNCRPAKTILVEHDLTFDLYQQLLAQNNDWDTQRQLERWIQFERTAWSQVDAVVVMSEKDRKVVGENAVTIPNGVDLQRFQPAPTDGGSQRILFIGSFAHLPNVLAVDFFLRQAWPEILKRCPNAVFHIIAGARPHYFLERYQEHVRPELHHPQIELEAFVEDVRPAYEQASVVVAPLVASAGTNIKIMEAMAMARAVVATPAAIHGLELDSGSDLIVVDSGAAMAEAVIALLENPEQRRRLGQQARATVERNFDWDQIAQRQSELYTQLIHRLEKS
ncbi:MAG: glycosyltransferase [Bryobacteraceae bacterium]|nr:glycosyltransferase [Bryobacteraceae bacterium]MDW8378314.1 glycosyltransferase [Bryobacterales bacterium]